NNPDCLCDSRGVMGAYFPNENLVEVGEDSDMSYNDTKERHFITGEIDKDGRRLIEVRIEKGQIQKKYEYVDNRSIVIEKEEYDGDLPNGFYEAIDLEEAQNLNNIDYEQEQPKVEVGDTFEDIASLALKTILEKLISIEDRLEKLEQ